MPAVGVLRESRPSRDLREADRWASASVGVMFQHALAFDVVLTPIGSNLQCSPQQAAPAALDNSQQMPADRERAQAHATLPKKLAEVPEEQLSSSDDPEVLELVAACARASYQAGALYLQALKARQDAARIGSGIGIMRWTRAIAAAKARVQADAEAGPVSSPEPPVPVGAHTEVGSSAGARSALKRGRLLGAVALAAAASSLVIAVEWRQQNSTELGNGSERAQPAQPIASAKRHEVALKDAGRPDKLAAARLPALTAPEITGSVQPGAGEQEAKEAANAAPSGAAKRVSPASLELIPRSEGIPGKGQVTLFVPPPVVRLPDGLPTELQHKTAPPLQPLSAGDQGGSVGSEDIPASADTQGNASAQPASLNRHGEVQIAPVVVAPPREPTPDTPLSGPEPALPAPTNSGGDDTYSAEVTVVERPTKRAQEPDQNSGTDLRTVRGEAVRMRRQPSKSAQILALLSSGAVLRVDRTESAWSHVTAPDGLSGWIATEYLTETPLGSTRDPTQGRTAPGPSFVVDTVAPEPPALQGFWPDSGINDDGLTNHSELVLTGTAEPGSTVTIRNGETELGTAATNSSGAWSFSTEILPDGVLAITAASSDLAGNTSAVSAALAVTIDTSAPPVTLSAVKDDATGAPVASGGVTNDPTPTLSGTAEAGSTVEVILSRADSQDIVLTAPLSGTDWSVTPATPLPDGPYVISVKATDRAGNMAQVRETSSK